MIQAAMTFALSAHGRVVHIDDVANGARCECICSQCAGLLIAKNGGQERAHHFAHESGTECAGGAETAIHVAAKQIVADYKRIALPLPIGEMGNEKAKFSVFDQVQLEFALLNSSTQQRIIADCYAQNSLDLLIIEIAVFHRVDSDKATMIEDLGIPAIEIDLSDQIGKMVDWNNLIRLVLFDMSRRRWILAPQVQHSLSIPTPTDTFARATPIAQPKEWCFAMGTTWIWVKELPFGNIRVFHRYDEGVRQIVEPICRSRGYWNAQYKNWIVFDRFKTEILELLAKQAQPLYFPTQ